MAVFIAQAKGPVYIGVQDGALCRNPTFLSPPPHLQLALRLGLQCLLVCMAPSSDHLCQHMPWVPHSQEGEKRVSIPLYRMRAPHWRASDWLRGRVGRMAALAVTLSAPLALGSPESHGHF